MELILVRHGETVENTKFICQGQTHGTLTEKGLSQAQMLAGALTGAKIDLCYTSDLRRAAETCAIITSQHPGLHVTHDVRLRERSFGPHQGKAMPQEWNGLADFAGAESIEAVYQRVSTFIADITATCNDNTILVVSHGITLKLLVAACLGYDAAQAVTLTLPGNCSISRLAMQKALPFTITEYNTVSHLDTPGEGK